MDPPYGPDPSTLSLLGFRVLSSLMLALDRYLLPRTPQRVSSTRALRNLLGGDGSEDPFLSPSKAFKAAELAPTPLLRPRRNLCALRTAFGYRDWISPDIICLVGDGAG